MAIQSPMQYLTEEVYFFLLLPHDFPEITQGLWVRIQTSLKNTKWATEAKEWSTH
jgi:hypothetical protein